jgi:hypothetical protein
MNKKKIIITIIVLFSIVFLSGCQEEENVNAFPENISLESDIIELVYAELVEHLESGNVKQVDVQYLLKNAVDRTISFNLIADFYDEENNLLYSGQRSFENIFEGYTETVISPLTNVISYSDVNASKVDRVTLRTEER